MDTILLKGTTGYLRDLKPFADTLYEKSGGKTNHALPKQHPFVAYIAQALEGRRRKPVVEVVRQYIKTAKLKNKAEALQHLKPFLDFEAGARILNCKKLSQQVPFIIAYKHLKNSIIYFESVMQ